MRKAIGIDAIANTSSAIPIYLSKDIKWRYSAIPSFGMGRTSRRI